MNIAIVGCGFVADQYMSTLAHCRELKLLTAYDHNPGRLQAFSKHHRIPAAPSLEHLLAHNDVEMVLNLTNPRSHFEVTSACFKAGKHVYSEKPLAMDLAGAERLMELANECGVRLSAAPCNLLGRTAQTLWKCIRDGAIGEPALVYGTFDAGYIAPHEKPWDWTSTTGAHWPAKDEFEVGCTFEHAGYLLGCLVAMFGSVKSVTAFATTCVPDKGIEVDSMAPDFTVGCLEFVDSNVVARVTCGITAPREKSLLVVGRTGYASVETVRDDHAPVHVVPHARGLHSGGSLPRRAVDVVQRRLERRWKSIPGVHDALFMHKRYPYAIERNDRVVSRRKPVDFSLGPLEFAAAIRENRPCRLDAALGVHIVELINALQYPNPANPRHEVKTRVPPIEPLPWLSEGAPQPSRVHTVGAPA